MYGVEGDPLTYSEAITLQHLDFWEEATNDEMDSIMENITWCWKTYLQGAKPLVVCIVDKFKAWLVAQGFRQKRGVDHFDTYALHPCMVIWKKKYTLEKRKGSL